MNNQPKYIIVDDDQLSCTLCDMTIKKALGETDVKIFTIPEDGLAYIQNDHSNSFGSTILLLDLNMPTITGWEFLEQFEKFSDEIQAPISIYLLSSSVDQRDKDKAKANKSVKGFISKPLSSEIISSITAHAA